MPSTPAASNPRYRPVAVKVHISTGAGLDILWEDAHQSHYDFSYLRENCPCAVCNDERQHPSVPAGTPALPLYKPRPGATKASQVGHYAIHFDFSDGHMTGIYTYEFLRDMCPCDECRKRAVSGA